MAEIAILRRVREEQERRQMTRTRRRPNKNTALLLGGGVALGGYLMYNGVNRFLNRNLVNPAGKRAPFPDGAVTASGALLLLGGLSLLARMARGSARH